MMGSTTIGREALLGLLPHAGAMCLLDSIERWDAANILCRSFRYARADNPLRRSDGALGASALIEIAAQAMAAHGRLTASARGAGAGGPPRPGFLVSLRDVRLRAPLLPAELGPLAISARLLQGEPHGASYSFSVRAGSADRLRDPHTVGRRDPRRDGRDNWGEDWATGRATVLFEAPL